MKRLLMIIFLLSILSLFAGCVTTSDYTVLRNDLNQLTRLYNEQQKEIVAVKQQVIDYKTFLEKSPSKDAFESIRSSQIKLNDQLAEINEELQQIQNRLDESNYQLNRDIKSTQEQQQQLKAEIESIKEELQTIKEKIGLLPSVAPEVPSAEEPKPQVAEPLPEEKTKVAKKEVTPFDVYQAALRKLEEGKLEEARADFQSFIKKYSNSDLIDNAQFWIAESYYKEGSYEDAILEYDVLINKYPKSNKVPGAMLKQAYAFLKLDDPNTAKVILNRLIQKYPKSREAELAKKKLGSLGSSKKSP